MSGVQDPAEVTAGDSTGKSNVNEDAATRARDAGWSAPQKYDYAAFAPPQALVEGDSKDKGPEEAAQVIEPFESEEEFALEWASSAQKYEWSDEYGDTGPAIPELEKMLFQSEWLNRAGVKFEHLRGIKVTAESTHQPAPIDSFHTAGLHPVVVENIRLCGYKVPTPIQAYAIPAVLTGHDLIAVAQTGSGKTAAFLIPVLSKLMGKAKKLCASRPNLANGFDSHTDAVRAEPLVLIVVPTRELSTQIFDEARRLCYRSMLRPCVVYGGGPVREQRSELQKGCDILIGTPGRLLDFMAKPHVLTLHRVKYTIIDEADELLQGDWQDEFGKIMAGGDSNEDADHHYMMFSATFNKHCRELAREFLAANHVRIRIGRAGSAHMNVKQQIIYTDDNKKQQALYDLLLAMPPARTLVFVNSKARADLVDDYLFNMGLPSTSIHSDRNQREREDALRAFKTAKSPILVATSVSARGLDIRNVMHVVNFELPKYEHGGIDEYIHRIGRTARIGNEGLATSFYNDRDEDLGKDLVKVFLECNQPIPDFLEHAVPENGAITFDDDTDNEGEEDDEDEEEGTQDGDEADKPGQDAGDASTVGVDGGQPQQIGW